MNPLYSVDPSGTAHVSNQGIIELAYQNKLNSAMFEWQDSDAKQRYQQVCGYLDTWPMEFKTVDAQDRSWFTPSDYQNIDLDEYVLSRCKNPAQQARATLELKIIHQIGAEHIFLHLIYLVDQWRSQGLVWGVGRGSSVSCFVLYVIGVNRINPLDWDLDHTEFFKTA
jgi:DNA polymerase III alpha subunit